MKKLFLLIAIAIVLLFIVSSCSMDRHMVSGRYTVSDVVSDYKLESLAKDTLVMKMNGNVYFESRDTTLYLGRWRVEKDGTCYIQYYHGKTIPFRVMTKQCGKSTISNYTDVKLLFRSSIYNKVFYNDKGVLKPL